MHSVKSNFLWNAAYQVVRIVIPLVITPYLTRVLGSEQLGVYSYTNSIASYFTLLVILGLNQYGTREIARHAGDRQGISRAFSSIFIMQLVCGTVVCALYGCYCVFFAGVYQLCAWMWGFWVLGEVFDTTWFFFGIEEFRLTTVRNLVVRLISVAAIFLLVHSDGDTWLYCLIMALYYFFASAALWPFLKNRISFVRPTAREVLAHVRPNLVLFAPVIAISFYTQFDKILLGAMSDMGQLGFYDNSERISQVPLAVVQSLGTVMLPRMSALLKQGDAEKSRHYLDNSFWLSSVMSLAFCFGIIGIAPVFSPVFFGPGFDPCIPLMMGLAPMIPIIAWSTVFGLQCLLPQGKDGQYLLSVVIGAAVNLVLNILLIPSMQGMGSVIATVAAELSVTVTQMVLLRGVLPFGAYFKGALPYLAIGAIMAAAVAFVGTFTGATVMGLAIGVLVGIVVYAGLSLVWMIGTHDRHLSILGMH